MTKDLEREVAELLELVHRLLLGDGDKKPAKRRMVLEIPEASATLMAWLAVRRHMENGGRSGPSPWRIQGLDSRGLRALARSYCAFVLKVHFEMQPQALATGTHPVLRQRTVTVSTIKGGPL